MAKYFVKKVEKCVPCEGKGIIQHPAWKEYWAENADKGTSMTKEDDRKWFEDHGWYPGSSIDVRIDGLPDEEIPCGECEGRGEIISEVDLATVIPEVILQLKEELHKDTRDTISDLLTDAIRA